MYIYRLPFWPFDGASVIKPIIGKSGIDKTGDFY